MAERCARISAWRKAIHTWAERGAAGEDIKRAFRDRIRLCHPTGTAGPRIGARDQARAGGQQSPDGESVRPLHHAMAERFAATGHWENAAQPSRPASSAMTPSSLRTYACGASGDLACTSGRRARLWRPVFADGITACVSDLSRLTTITSRHAFCWGWALGSRRMPEARSWEAMGLAVFSALIAEAFGLEASAV